MKPLIVLDLQVGQSSGWGVYATNLAKHALSRCRVGLTLPPKLAELNEADAAIIAAMPVYEAGNVPPGAITVTGLGNKGLNHRAGWPPDAPDRRLNVGVIFSEDTAWKVADVARLNTYDLIVAGSTWNADILKANGVTNVVTVFQGVDLDIFYPSTEPRKPGPFRVFSGGKLEYRKGQDIVVAAFREFHKSYPDSQLVVAWDNHWPSTMQDISVAGHTVGAPASNADIPNWLRANGVTAFENVGMIPHYRMGDVLRSCDAAVFPNRAEGGTNLCAAEALACGVPTIISDCTGHLDIGTAGDGAVHCAAGPLGHGVADGDPTGRIVGPIAGYTGTGGWLEVDPSAITRILTDQAAGHVIRGQLDPSWSWPLAIGRLLDACGIDR